jgi:hypothetical protein
MTKRTLAYCAALLMAGAGFIGACNDTIMAKDCKVKCQDVDNTCVQKCNSTDDQCKTLCTTDLDNCTASCGSVTASPPANPDGG